MTFIAGPYTATYDASDLGITQDGFRWSMTPLAQRIRGDNMGDTTQDAVHRGMSFTLEMILEEYDKAGIVKLLWPFHATFGNHGQAGKLYTNLTKSLVLTAVAGTTASTVPATMTFPYAIVDPDFANTFNFEAKLRVLPVRLLILPNANNVFFTQT